MEVNSRNSWWSSLRQGPGGWSGPASERSGWLTGRVLSASGCEVGRYANPEIIRQLSAPEPWQYERLAAAMEGSFKPAADGLPPSAFASQIRG